MSSEEEESSSSNSAPPMFVVDLTNWSTHALEALRDNESDMAFVDNIDAILASHGGPASHSEAVAANMESDLHNSDEAPPVNNEAAHDNSEAALENNEVSSGNNEAAHDCSEAALDNNEAALENNEEASDNNEVGADNNNVIAPNIQEIPLGNYAADDSDSSELAPEERVVFHRRRRRRRRRVPAYQSIQICLSPIPRPVGEEDGNEGPPRKRKRQQRKPRSKWSAVPLPSENESSDDISKPGPSGTATGRQIAANVEAGNSSAEVSDNPVVIDLAEWSERAHNSDADVSGNNDDVNQAHPSDTALNLLEEYFPNSSGNPSGIDLSNCSGDAPEYVFVASNTVLSENQEVPNNEADQISEHVTQAGQSGFPRMGHHAAVNNESADPDLIRDSAPDEPVDLRMRRRRPSISADELTKMILEANPNFPRENAERPRKRRRLQRPTTRRSSGLVEFVNRDGQANEAKETNDDIIEDINQPGTSGTHFFVNVIKRFKEPFPSSDSD